MASHIGVALVLAWALVACRASVGQTAPTFQPDDTPTAFEDETMAFEHPAEWREWTFEVMPSSHANWVVVFLSTAALTNPCQTTGNMTSCSGYPVLGGLGPNGVVVYWAHRAFPGWELDAALEQINVGGRRATVNRSVTELCSGGERRIEVQVENPIARYNWDEMSACYRGPDFDRIEAGIDEMLASVRWIELTQAPQRSLPPLY